MAALENTNGGLRAEIIELTFKSDSERVALQQDLEKKGSTIIQKKTVTRLMATV